MESPIKKIPVFFFHRGKTSNNRDYEQVIVPHEDAPQELISEFTNLHKVLANGLPDAKDACVVFSVTAAGDKYTLATCSRRIDTDDRSYLRTLGAAVPSDTLRDLNADPMQFASAINWNACSEWQPTNRIDIEVAPPSSSAQSQANDVYKAHRGRMQLEKLGKLLFAEQCAVLSAALRKLPEQTWFTECYAFNVTEALKLPKSPKLGIYVTPQSLVKKQIPMTQHVRVDDIVLEIWKSQSLNNGQMCVLSQEVHDVHLAAAECDDHSKIKQLAGNAEILTQRASTAVNDLLRAGLKETATRLQAIVDARTRSYALRLEQHSADSDKKMWILVAIVAVIAAIVLAFGIVADRVSSDSAVTSRVSKASGSNAGDYALVGGSPSTQADLEAHEAGHGLIVYMVDDLEAADVDKVRELVSIAKKYPKANIMPIILCAAPAKQVAVGNFYTKVHRPANMGISVGPSAEAGMKDLKDGDFGLPQILYYKTSEIYKRFYTVDLTDVKGLEDGAVTIFGNRSH